MRRGDVWQISLDPTVGAEIRKTRPAVIVSHDSVGILPLKVVVPITDWKPQYAEAPWMVRLTSTKSNGLTKVSAADTFQVRSVSHARFVTQLGTLSARQMQEIRKALTVVLAL